MNGGVTYDGEMTVPTLTCPLESSKAARDIRSCEAIMTGLLQGVQGFCFSSHSTYGGVELMQLVFILAIARDVCDDTPIAKVDGRVV